MLDENNTIMPNMSNIDEKTLELLTNQNHYKKYLSKTNPLKYAEKNNYLAKIEQYKSKIYELTAELIEHPETQITNELNTSFYEYIKSLCRYFEMKELENSGFEKSHKDDDCELFSRIDNPCNYSSLWGGIKVTRHQTNDTDIL
jgi:hypothetical protein